MTNDFLYHAPNAAYLFFFVVLFLGLFWFLASERQKHLSRFTDPSLLRELVYPRQQILADTAKLPSGQGSKMSSLACASYSNATT